VPHSLPDFVAEKIATDREAAAGRADEMKRSPQAQNWGISELFPETRDLWAPPSNHASGVPLLHQLLLGPPTVFDLEPLEPAEFEERHKICIRTAERLVERGMLIPNLYVRSPAAWNGKEHLRTLLERCLVNGERVDVYLRSKNPRYDTLLQEHSDRIEGHAQDLEKKDPQRLDSLVAAARAPRDRMPKVIGTRWAYLDLLAPHASAHVHELFEAGRVEDAVEFIRISKHIYVSETTAAIGGKFQWGPKDIARLETTEIPATMRFAPETRHFQNPECMDFIVRQLANLPPARVPGDEFINDAEVNRLLPLIDDLQTTKASLSALMDSMTALMAKGEVKESNFKSWKELNEGINGKIASYDRAGDFGMAAIIGFCINPWLGVGAGVFAQVLKAYTPKVGKHILRFSDPVKHRFLTHLDALKTRTKK
jgi:hypothetical protein